MKIEQIAFGAKDPHSVIEQYKLLGIDEWVGDVVIAKGTVNKTVGENCAELYFNYQLGFELEILRYQYGPNWHQDRNPNNLDVFPSHQGLHVDETEMWMWREKMNRLGIDIIQEVYTQSHTNPVIAGKRRYQYVIFNSLDKLGFDLKLIRRINL